MTLHAVWKAIWFIPAYFCWWLTLGLGHVMLLNAEEAIRWMKGEKSVDLHALYDVDP